MTDKRTLLDITLIGILVAVIVIGGLQYLNLHEMEERVNILESRIRTMDVKVKTMENDAIQEENAPQQSGLLGIVHSIVDPLINFFRSIMDRLLGIFSLNVSIP